MRRGPSWCCSTALALAIFAATVPLAALYAVPETRNVPVARLVANLERAVKSDPKNVDARINLARLHGMAYALKTEELTATRWHNAPDDEPYYGIKPNIIPYKPVTAPTEAAARAARRHLTQGIAQYEAALAIEPGNLLARLGYGWMLDQAGAKERAVAEYRRVVRDAWVKEEHAQRILPEDKFFTHEAAGYLISLLDPLRDAEEIADLRAKQQVIETKPARAITPLAIPLIDAAKPRDIVAPHARVPFDADGSGLRRHWSWIATKAGWLVHDPAGAGRITSALQWFGNVTFWLFWDNGYRALAALDDDASGELSGDELRDLAIWHDRNTNGISEAGEVRPLSDHGIVGLSCRYLAANSLTFAGISPDGVRLSDGRTRTSYDVMLRPADVRTLTRR